MPRPTRPTATPDAQPAATLLPPHHHHHLHNPLDAPLAGHKRSERLLTWLIIAHVIGACALAYRFWRRGVRDEGGEGAPARARRGGPGRVPSRPMVSAAYSFADLADTGPTSVVVDWGGGGSAEMVGMGARRVSRGALRRV